MIHSDKQKKISFTVLQNYCEVLEVGFVVEYVLGSTVNQDGTIYYGKSGFKISVGSLTHYKDRSEIIYPTLDEALQAGYKLAQRIERLGKNQHRAVSMR